MSRRKSILSIFVNMLLLSVILIGTQFIVSINHRAYAIIDPEAEQVTEHYETNKIYARTKNETAYREASSLELKVGEEVDLLIVVENPSLSSMSMVGYGSTGFWIDFGTSVPTRWQSYNGLWLGKGTYTARLGDSVINFALDPSVGAYDIYFRTLPIKVTEFETIRIHNIVLGHKTYSDVGKNTATRMIEGSLVNTEQTPYTVFVGDTLDLAAVEVDSSHRFEVSSDSSGVINPNINEAFTEAGSDDEVRASFLGLTQGNARIDLINSENNIVDSIYLFVRNPIYVETAVGPYRKDALNEYVQVALWDLGPENIITDPNGNKIYVKNNQNAPVCGYWLYPGDTVVLSTIASVGRATDSSKKLFQCSQGLKAVTKEPKIFDYNDNFKRIEQEFEVTAKPSNPEQNLWASVNFDQTAFYILIRPENDGNANHFDIEIADNGIVTTITKTNRLDGSYDMTTSTYQAEVIGVNECQVLGSEEKVLATLESCEYWSRTGRLFKDDTQFELTSAYETNKDGNLIRYPEETVITEEDLERGVSPVVKYRRWINPSSIKQVKFDTDLYLIPKIRTVTTYNKDGVVLESTQVEGFENEDGQYLNDQEIVMDYRDIVDAHNKCPNHIGYDFTFNSEIKQEIDTKTSQLTVRKAVTGDYHNRDLLYNFEIKLYDSAGQLLEGERPFKIDSSYSRDIRDENSTVRDGYINFTDGVARFSLKEDQSITIEALPVDYSYEVREINSENYNVTPEEGFSGYITFEPKELEFSNALKLGDLSVTKIMENVPSDFDQAFDFEVTLSPPVGYELLGQYKILSSTDGESTVSLAQGNILKFNLKPGETKTIKGLPVGTGYQVSETSKGFVAEYTNEKGNITADETKSVSVTNSPEPVTVSLNGTKTLDGSQLVNGQFSFSITPDSQNPEGDPFSEPITISNDATGSIPLFKDVKYTRPGTYVYTIAEVTSPGSQYIEYDNRQYTVTIKIDYGQNNLLGKLVSEVSITENNQSTNKIEFQNTYNGPQVPAITIEKEQKVNEGERTKDLKEVGAEDVVTYYLTVRSVGKVTAEGVFVKDRIPAGLTLVDGSITASGVLQEDNETIIWNLGDMDPGTVQEVSFQVKVPQVQEYTQWINIASTNYHNNPDNPEDPEEPPTEIPSNEVKIENKLPALTIEKDQARNAGERVKDLLDVEKGDTVTYYLTVTSTGKTTAENVIVRDRIPQEPVPLKLKEGTISDSGELSSDGITIIWHLGDMEPGEVKTVSFEITVPEVNQYTKWTNIGSVSFTNNPENPSDPDEPPIEIPSNEVEIQETPPGLPKIIIEKEQSRNGGERTKSLLGVEEKDIITYYLTVTNVSEVTAEDVIVVDKIPQTPVPLQLVDGSISDQGILGIDKITITWKLGNLEPKVSKTVSFKVTVPHVEQYSRWENSGLTNFKNNPDNPTDPGDPDKPRTDIPSNKVEIEENLNPILGISKFHALSNDDYHTNLNEVRSGDSVWYLLHIKNVGKTTAHHVIIYDALPKTLTLTGKAQYTIGQSPKATNKIGLNILPFWNREKDLICFDKINNLQIDLAPNEEINLEFEAKVAANLSEETYWTNHSWLSYDELVNEKNRRRTLSNEYELSPMSLNYTSQFDRILNTDKINQHIDLDHVVPGSISHYHSNGIDRYPEILNNRPVKYSNDVREHFNLASNPGAQKTELSPGNGKRVQTNDVITYQISYTNIDRRGNIIITDPLDQGLTYISSSPEGNYNPATHTITWTFGNQEPGATGSVVLVTRVNEKAVQIVKNAAQVSFSNGSKITTNEVSNPLEEGKLTIEKLHQFAQNKETTENQVVTRGGTLTYSIKVSNPSSTRVENITVSDTIPAGLTYVEGSVSDNGKHAGNSVYWNIAGLNPGESIVVSFKAIVPNEEKFTHWENKAYVDWEDNPDSPIESNTVVDDTPDISILKEQSTSGKNTVDRTTSYIEFIPGDIVTYYITVKNIGCVASTNTVITDRIPSGLVLQEDSATSGVKISGDLLTWNVGTLQPGEAHTVQVSFSCQLPEIVLEKIYFRNIAYVSWNENGSNNPKASNEVIIGDPPASNETPSSTPTNSSNSTVNKTSSNVTKTGNNVTQTGVSPKTGVTVSISIFVLVALAAVLVLLDQIRRNKESDNSK